MALSRYTVVYMGFESIRRFSKSPEQEAEKEKVRELYARSQEIIRGVDFGTLKDIFIEERRKAGVEKTDKFHCSLDRVSLRDLGIAAGGQQEGKVYLNPVVISEGQIDDNFEKIPPQKLNLEGEIVSTLIHEETHGAAMNTGSPVSPPTEIGALIRTYFFSKPARLDVSGYGSGGRFEKGRSQGMRYFFFNEAVTDKIAEDVWSEYRVRTGQHNGKEEKFRSNYFYVVSLLEAVLSHISVKTEVPYDEVWKSVKQGYFTGLDLDSTELAEAFDELAMAGLMQDVATLKTGPVIPALIENLDIEHATPEVQARIERGIKVIQMLSERQKEG